MKPRVFVLVAIVALGLWYMPLRAQQAPATQSGVPVTTPSAAETPNDKPSPNVSAKEAVPVQQVPSPAAPEHAPDQVLWALIVSYAIQYLKNASWFPFLTNATSARLKAVFGFVAAAATAAGIHFAVSGTVLDGTGAVITISGLSLDAIKDVAFQWAAQQGWFDLLTHKRSALEGVTS